MTVEKDVRSSKNILACPVCYEPVTLIGATVLSVQVIFKIVCRNCYRSWHGNSFVFVIVGFGTEILHVDLVCSAALVRRHTLARKHILN